MRKTMLLALALVVGLGMVAPVAAEHDGVSRFATLPFGGPAYPNGNAPGQPEGMAIDEDGTLYVASFELTEFFGPAERDALAGLFGRRASVRQGEPRVFAFNYIYVFDSSAELRVSVPVPNGVIPLGMIVVGRTLYVNDVINGDILAYSLPLREDSRPARTYDICGGYLVAFGAPGTFCALNDITRGPDGGLYSSDNGDASINQITGRVYRLYPESGESSVFFQDPVLNAMGFPTFGVNGISFTPDGSGFIMVNMSTDNIYRLAVSRGQSGRVNPGGLSLFARTSEIDGPDDIVYDEEGRLWVTSGQNHQIVALNQEGQVVDTRGEFEGFDGSGAPLGLLQPSSIVYRAGRLFMTNEANPTLLPERELRRVRIELLRRYTVSQTFIGVPVAATNEAVIEAVNDPNNDDEDEKRKLTEEQKRQRERTNTGSLDDIGTEGNVVGVRCDLSAPVPTVQRGFVAAPNDAPYVLIAMRDGVQQVRLLHDAKSQCGSVQVGDYIQVDGEKVHEQLFDADDMSITRGGRSR